MCIGIPMQVIEQRDLMALCRGRGREEMVNTMLIGPQEPGTWILNFIGSAREVLTEDEAKQTNNALDAMEQIMSGNDEVDIDTYFADLTDPNRAPGSFPTDKS
jgi:hydrogenase expression/formation protein HypC